MISFGMTEEQELVRDAMREFADQALRPVARDFDEASSVSDEILNLIWDLGLVPTQIPEEFGGGGEPRSAVTNVIAAEELAWGDASLATLALATPGFVNAIVDQGSDEQKARLLPAFCDETPSTAVLAVTEPTALADPAQPRTIAEAKEDKFVISGRKSFVPLAQRASHFLVVARNGSELDAFIVPRDAEGVTISVAELNLGLRALPTGTVDFERVEVSVVDRLGGKAGSNVRRLLDNSRIALASIMLGLSRSVLEFCVPYAKDRVAFDEAIAKKQSIAFRLSDMHIEIEAMRWLIWKAASHYEQGLDSTKEAQHALQYTAEKSMWIADNGIQTLGGHGFIREHPVEMWFRNARTLGVLEGVVGV